MYSRENYLTFSDAAKHIGKNEEFIYQLALAHKIKIYVEFLNSQVAREIFDKSITTLGGSGVFIFSISGRGEADLKNRLLELQKSEFKINHDPMESTAVGLVTKREVNHGNKTRIEEKTEWFHLLNYSGDIHDLNSRLSLDRDRRFRFSVSLNNACTPSGLPRDATLFVDKNELTKLISGESNSQASLETDTNAVPMSKLSDTDNEGLIEQKTLGAKKHGRTHRLNHLILQAWDAASDKDNFQEAWAKFCELAQNKIYPLMGVTESGVKYEKPQDDNGFGYYTKEAFCAYLKRRTPS